MSNCYTFPNSSSRRGHLATVGAKEICQSTCTRRRTVAVFKADDIQLTFLTANASSWHRSVFLSPDGTILTLALLSIFDTSYARGCLPDCGRGQHETLDLCTQRSACDTLHYIISPSTMVMSLIVVVFRVLFLAVWGALRSLFSCGASKKKPDLSSDLCLVTGAGQGLGRQLALQLADCGASLVLWDIDGEKVHICCTCIGHSKLIVVWFLVRGFPMSDH